MKNFTVIDNNKNKEIRKTLKMTKMNLTQDDINEMEGFFAQRVFQPIVEIMDICEITSVDILKMITLHLININRSANKTSSCSKFKVSPKDTNRYVIISVSDVPSTLKTRNLVIKAYVSKPAPAEGFFDVEDLMIEFGIDPVLGLEDQWYDLDCLDEFCDTIQLYLQMTETRETEELRNRLYNFIMSENTKFIAMKNIDPQYNNRTAEATFSGVRVVLELTKYADEDQHTQLRLFSGALCAEGTIIGRLDSSTIRKHVRTILNKFIEDGGNING